MTYKKHTQPWEWLREGRTRNQKETALAVCRTLCLGHEETTASQSLYPTSPTILASFKQTITDMLPPLAKVPNPNIGSGSYSIHELIRTASLWLPTAFCLQVYICNTLSSLVWSLSSRCPQAPWNHCYLSNNKAPLSPLTECCIPHTSIFIHPQNIPSQIKPRQFCTTVLSHLPCAFASLLWEKDIPHCILQQNSVGSRDGTTKPLIQVCHQVFLYLCREFHRIIHKEQFSWGLSDPAWDFCNALGCALMFCYSHLLARQKPLESPGFAQLPQLI